VQNAGQVPHCLAIALGFRQPGNELLDRVAQPVHILVTVEQLRHRGRLRAMRIPQMQREDQRIPARIVVEDGFRRRVR
jgi:hypothetical protein